MKEFERIGIPHVSRMLSPTQTNNIDERLTNHLSCLVMSNEGNAEMCLIMENEVNFQISNWNQVTDAINDLVATDPKWEIVLLNEKLESFGVTNDLLKLLSAATSCAYIAHKRSYLKAITVLSESIKFGANCDHLNKNESLHLQNFYAMQPPMVVINVNKHTNKTTHHVINSSIQYRPQRADLNHACEKSVEPMNNFKDVPSTHNKIPSTIQEIHVLLEKNKELRNTHAGKRCFIVGNGPSRNFQNLEFLKDEICIVVNGFYLQKDLAKSLRPRYWVIADPLYWENPEKYLQSELLAAKENGVYTKFFVPINGYEVFSKIDTGDLIDKYYYWLNHSSASESLIDFSTGIPPYAQNVIMVALMLAFHLGCDPIYFIGCDHDFTKITQEEFEHGQSMTHAVEEQNTDPLSLYFKWNEYCAALNRMDLQYSALRRYADQCGINVFNATDGGYFEHFPRVNFDSLFKHTNATALNELNVNRRDVNRLSDLVLKLIETEDPYSALILINYAINNKYYYRTRPDLYYLKAICLLKAKSYELAQYYCDQDRICNPSNLDKSDALAMEIAVAQNKIDRS